MDAPNPVQMVAMEKFNRCRRDLNTVEDALRFIYEVQETTYDKDSEGMYRLRGVQYSTVYTEADIIFMARMRQSRIMFTFEEVEALSVCHTCSM